MVCVLLTNHWLADQFTNVPMVLLWIIWLIQFIILINYTLFRNCSKPKSNISRVFSFLFAFSGLSRSLWSYTDYILYCSWSLNKLKVNNCKLTFLFANLTSKVTWKRFRDLIDSSIRQRNGFLAFKRLIIAPFISSV